MKQLTFKQKVVQGIYDLFYIWKQEFRTTFRDQGVLIFFVLVPLVYPLIYSFIYTNETIREVPTVVVDDSRSSLSREYLRKVDASPETSIVAYCADMEEAKLMLKDRKAYGIIYIPAHFSDDIVQGKQTQVSIFCDMSGLLYYKALLTANTNVSLAMNAAIKMERAGNTTARQDEITAYPIEYEDVAIFNPTNGFAAFLIPAVLILIIQQTLLLGIGLSAGTAREHNQFKDLVPINRHYNGTLRIVMGKGLSYFMVYSLVAVYILCVVPRLFSLNQIAIPGVLTLFTLPYLTACIFFAMTSSIAIRNRETCMLLFVFTSVPLLFLSGISWPGSAMPSFWRYFSYLFPSTFGINGYVRINSMGATLNEVAFEYRALWMQTGIYFLTTCFVYRRQIIQSRKNHSSLYPARL
ncbi:ABC transporter permease [Bacteroides eggerthii]|jgi:ABC-2 type transport system permease protein|uniref:ABC transporter permease n=1 Tax=Bacteroides eggerthii TaxID=28111 RepID=UPI001C37886D|nr:ABC transporter permease [Bacteroides eggerthii]MBV3845005.1 ABC transporter permease [Bacteroides eggerthii]MBV3847770.1 ABC transporter permease [Bacteroides eggerthii]MBV3885951.1 ABC transporter permease [Bacteroides eggerthii]MBV3892904.1 ABC transporter permease [Bacteroides eggerthii]MBV3904061.1 ABC transporter permease [Bacteroides eggerthii]